MFVINLLPYDLNGTRKNGRRKMVPGKNSPRKIDPRKNVLQKLFSVKIMLGNLKDFFYFYRLIPLLTQKDVWHSSHDPTCTKLLNTKGGSQIDHIPTFHTHTTMLGAQPTIFPGTNFPGTNFPRTIFPGTFFLGVFYPGIFSRRPFSGTVFPGTVFPGTIFPGFIAHS